MFFRFFKNKDNQNSSWLFFNRNRLSVDYKITGSNYLPQFGSVNALSFNRARFKGLAPVVLLQILNSGVYPKSGIQYAHTKSHLTVFTWLVCETLKNSRLDYFLLIRYQKVVNTKIKLFTQFETLNTFPLIHTNNFSFTQRVRIGLLIKDFQFGPAIDLNQYGQKVFTKKFLPGCFIRYEF